MPQQLPQKHFFLIFVTTLLNLKTDLQFCPNMARWLGLKQSTYYAPEQWGIKKLKEMFILSYTLSRLLISYNTPLASQLGSLIIRLDCWIKIHLIRSILEYQIQELALILEVEMPLSHFRIPGLEFPVLASDCNILLINCWKSAIDDSNNWVTAIHVEVLNWVSSS